MMLDLSGSSISRSPLSLALFLLCYPSQLFTELASRSDSFAKSNEDEWDDATRHHDEAQY